MDFTLTEDLQAVVDLADRVLRDHGEPNHLAEVEAAGGFDTSCWRSLAETGLLGVPLPERAGGAGLGWLAVHLLVQSAGEHVAHVPLVETLTAASALGGLGGHDDLLADVVAGRSVITLALQDVGAPVHDPVTVATVVDDGQVRVSGTKVVVPWAAQSDHLLVTARSTTRGEPLLAMVAADEVTVDPQTLSSDVPHGAVHLDEAVGTLVGAQDAGAADWLLDRAVAALASHQAGMLSAAVRLAATHTSEREQFGRPIATFQAVTQRVASAFIDAECARLTALQAAWRLHEELPAGDEVAIAKWWAAEAGHRVLHAAQHVHGGIGVDREYPLHRYLLRTKQVEFALGSAADHLGRLGASLASDPA